MTLDILLLWVPRHRLPDRKMMSVANSTIDSNCNNVKHDSAKEHKVVHSEASSQGCLVYDHDEGAEPTIARGHIGVMPPIASPHCN